MNESQLELLGVAALVALAIYLWRKRRRPITLTDTTVDREIANLMRAGFHVERQDQHLVILSRPRPFDLFIRRADVMRLEINDDGSITRLG
jgi:hypothetical protein